MSARGAGEEPHAVRLQRVHLEPGDSIGFSLFFLLLFILLLFSFVFLFFWVCFSPVFRREKDGSWERSTRV